MKLCEWKGGGNRRAVLLLLTNPNLQLLCEGLKSVNEGTDSSVLDSAHQMSFSALYVPRKELCLFQSCAQILFLPELKQTEKHFCGTVVGAFWVMMGE